MGGEKGGQDEDEDEKDEEREAAEAGILTSAERGERMAACKTWKSVYVCVERMSLYAAEKLLVESA